MAAASNSKPIVVVASVGGRQGCPIACELLKTNKFQIRGIVKKPEDAKSCGKHVEIVVADYNDKNSLSKPMQNAWGAYLVTHYWAKDCLSEDKEVQTGKNLIDACKESGAKFAVFSGNECAKGRSGGKCNVPHFDSKNRIEQYLTESSLDYTVIRYPFYFENFLMPPYLPVKKSDGKFYLMLALGNSSMYMMSSNDGGSIIATLFDQAYAGSNQYSKQVLNLATEHLCGKDIADTMSKALGVEIVYSPISLDELRNMKIESDRPTKLDDVAAMFAYFTAHEQQVEKRDIELTKKLNPNFTTFEKWCVAYKSQFMQLLK